MEGEDGGAEGVEERMRWLPRLEEYAGYFPGTLFGVAVDLCRVPWRHPDLQAVRF